MALLKVVATTTSTSLSGTWAEKVVQELTSSWAMLFWSASTPCTISPIKISVLPQPHGRLSPPTNHIPFILLVVCSISLTRICPHCPLVPLTRHLTDNSCIP